MLFAFTFSSVSGFGVFCMLAIPLLLSFRFLYCSGVTLISRAMVYNMLGCVAMLFVIPHVECCLNISCCPSYCYLICHAVPCHTPSAVYAIYILMVDFLSHTDLKSGLAASALEISQ